MCVLNIFLLMLYGKKQTSFQKKYYKKIKQKDKNKKKSVLKNQKKV